MYTPLRSTGYEVIRICVSLYMSLMSLPQKFHYMLYILQCFMKQQCISHVLQ